MGMKQRLKILVCAYACSPVKGSEPGVGWGFVHAMARYHDLWVIVEEEKFRKDIADFLKENPDLSHSVQFIFIRKRRNRLLRRIWPPSYYWYYRLWHEEAFEIAKKMHEELHFDLVHQLTMVGFREPGYLWKLGIPFVWGPVGGMGLFPWRFLPTLGVSGACYYAGYNLYNVVQTRFMCRPRKAARAAGKGLIFATSENACLANTYWSCDGVVIPEVGLPGILVAQTRVRKHGESLAIVWSGMHVPRKALNIALHAVARLPASSAWELHILGEGKRTDKWKRLAEQLGVARHCHFHGLLPRKEALAIMRNAHVMLITSLRDLTSTVTIEALSLGLPVVTLNHCGFATAVDDSCGLKISVTTPEEVISGITAALQSLEQDEQTRQLLGRGALERACNFTWEEKAVKVNGIYRARLEEATIRDAMKS
jgi:glycosyltransferase involved in cell wall biosynthesis